ncbi:hypothetical protein [Aquiflexum lacus]|uniref:hypothetical protein n=1 Tax=Aquiflexum lacus TaxID=2483805 RepID=UPI00189529D0|nr:hypothetical protein [Aquiflexum lacus]
MLRYIASGFMGLLIYMFLFEINIDEINISKDSLFLVITAATMGLITYSIHVAFLDNYFYNKQIKKIFVKNSSNSDDVEKCMSNFNPEWKPGSEVSIDEIRFHLFSQSYLRQISSDKNVRKLQRLMEKQLSLLTFLYCTIYQIFILIIYFFIRTVVIEKKCLFSVEFLNFWFSLAAVLFLWYSVYCLDKRISLREIWLVANYFQKTE